eukprot:CAMPEP_0184972304 /NCGR_PEP_ID=MMETSP1098-20130426/4322_1 /TAXON_ID=89044 /ORGANISM="Spumella elongata, Strain CCAP 955/1" /LENGTH=52 /DNA_ID=CAMNT_0027494557 /DNA_START=173 /DNA_END=331 /DNA_ORIENTATION=-
MDSDGPFPRYNSHNQSNGAHISRQVDTRNKSRNIDLRSDGSRHPEVTVCPQN